jgi:hypothetical protein
VAIDVRLIGGHRQPVTQILTVAAALASPIVSFLVAAFVTSRTIRNDREQRVLDREHEWFQQIHDRQLTSAADFGHSAFHALVILDRLHPLDHEATTDELSDSKKTLDEARRAMASIQLLFRDRPRGVAAEAEAIVDQLDTAQYHLEQRNASADPVARAEAQSEYVSAIDDARRRYQTFLVESAAAIETRP